MTDRTVIEFKDVGFSYSAGVPVLNEVSFTVKEHDLLCMIGPNGGGKSTLIMLMLGLLVPDKGSVELFGCPSKTERGRIGYMPQHAHLDQQFPVDVMDVVAMGRLRKGAWRFSQQDKKACLDALDEMQVGDLAQRHYFSLSGGQRQRVLVARALAGDPELLLLDEPTSNVDPAAQDQFYGILAELGKRLTVLIVSHDLGLVSNRMNRVICVNERVRVHPVSEITGAVIEELYDSKMHLVRHDHCCSERGHTH